ncbi:MAG: NUDIX hydrolase [Bacteroidetes bacterium]|nr:MAG: NUDIX hydrolase [Bacteroidota bacterium]
MSPQEKSINPHISVDCVIFGFRDTRLKVLLIEREYFDSEGLPHRDYKLPGDFPAPGEDLDMAAYRTLEELTGLRDIYLKQYAVFGKPDRLSASIDRNWLYATTGHRIERVVSSAYFALVSIPETERVQKMHSRTKWTDLKTIPKLAFDHNDIIDTGYRHLQEIIRYEPIGFELLPEKFTLRQLQNVYEGILDCKLDNRNFRKKALKASYLEQLDEKQRGVAHKPAHFYHFNRMKYEKSRKNFYGFHF